MIILCSSSMKDCVEVVPPAFDQDLGFGQRVEGLAVEQLISEAGIEAIKIDVFSRFLWFSGLTRLDQPRHRRRSGRGPRIAGPSAEADVSHRYLRRASCQNSRCRQPNSELKGSLCGPWRLTGRRARGSK